MTATLRRAGHAIVIHQQRLTWLDTDATGYWHNSTAMRLIELAEARLFEHLFPQRRFTGLARVRIDVSFMSRLAPHDTATVTLQVNSVGRSSIDYRFGIRAQDSRTCATGHLIAVQVDHAQGRSLPWTTSQRAALLSPHWIDGPTCTMPKGVCRTSRE